MNHSAKNRVKLQRKRWILKWFESFQVMVLKIVKFYDPVPQNQIIRTRILLVN